MQSFNIGRNEAGQRLDKFLFKYLPGASKNLLYKQLRKKNITLNGHKASGDETLTIGDRVESFFSEETYNKFRISVTGNAVSTGSIKTHSLPSGTDVTDRSVDNKTPYRLPEIVYEDNDIIILNKPVGMLSQKAAASDLSANEFLIEHLLEVGTISEAQLSTFKPSVCNRLDRNTSGLLICGCSLPGVQEMTRLIREGSIGKYYRTVCSGIIDHEITVRGTIYKNHTGNISEVRNIKIIRSGNFPCENSAAENSNGGKSIITTFRPLESYGDKATLLEVILHTGKSHQIRAQLSAIGHPIIGDVKYDSEKYDIGDNAFSFQLLQSYKLVFPDKDRLSDAFKYLSDKEIVLDMPDEFVKVIRHLI